MENALEMGQISISKNTFPILLIFLRYFYFSYTMKAGDTFFD